MSDHSNNNESYKLFIDGDKYESSQRIVTGRELLAMAGLSENDFYLRYKGGKHGSSSINPDDQVDLSEEGTEHFVTFPKEAQEG